VLVSALVLASAGDADAQSPYVGASVLADVVRTSGPDDSDAGSGEAIGAAVRVGAALGPRWGVELEFVRSGEIEWHPDVTILAAGTTRRSDLFGALPDLSILPFPSPEISVESQLSTLTTSVWWRQRVNDRFDLVYLGGVTFARSQLESEVSYASPLPGGRLGQRLPTRLYAQETTDYDTGVTVGLEGAIGMTEHLRIVPGVRMLALDSQWIIRPAVGLQWRF
jgi:hypothetical protein